jgi:hypothetical protein
VQVYANSFSVVGSEAHLTVLRSIHGWLKQITQAAFSVSDITRNNEFTSDTQNGFRWWLRSYVSADSKPELYAWRLKHSDIQVTGRQWIVELGLKVDDSTGLEFSCSVFTEEQSTLVRNHIDATRPRVIKYVLDNVAQSDNAQIAKETPGVGVKRIGTQTSDYFALKVEIERKNRDFPLILVSPTIDGKYLVDTNRLQEALFGLAQVVEIAPEFDSFEMEENLGKVWSAWRGAINILQTPRSNGYVHGSLLRATEIETIGEGQSERVSHILARVTHNTNVPRLRNRIRPEGVMQLALKRRLLERKSSIESNSTDLLAENTALWQELERQEENYLTLEKARDAAEIRVMELEDKNQELDDQLRGLEYKAKAMRNVGIESDSTPDINFLFEIASQATPPSAEDCLKAIKLAYPKKCEILDSAWQSSRAMNSFQNGRRLLSLLRRLITEYASEIENGGDVKARMIFSSEEYSANESETVEKSPTLSAKRRFVYAGNTIDMFKHLKIGKADNLAHTLRVHFAWIAKEKKIVIGHCGEHLPIASH